MIMPGLLGPAFRERLSAAMRLPVVETLFKEPWTAAARRVLPSPSPQMTATAMWAPIIAWCALETLAESIDAAKPEQIALDAFDRLRLRKPLAESFNALGFEGEAGWRAAARIKVVLLAETESINKPSTRPSDVAARTSTEPKPADAVRSFAGNAASFEPAAESAAAPKTPAAVVSKPIVAGLSRTLWSDPDVRWLTGVHDAGDHTYFVCEPYEELLWWLQMPALLGIASEPSPDRAQLRALSERVTAASAEADKAEYRLDTLLAPEIPDTNAEKAALREEPAVVAQPKTSRNEREENSSTANSSPDSQPKEDSPITSKK
jgi:hypothetical protein